MSEGEEQEGGIGGGERRRRVPDAKVEVIWLKSRHAIGPSWPDRTSSSRPVFDSIQQCSSRCVNEEINVIHNTLRRV